jgi:hypothetical protein
MYILSPIIPHKSNKTLHQGQVHNAHFALTDCLFACVCAFVRHFHSTFVQSPMGLKYSYMSLFGLITRIDWATGRHRYIFFSFFPNCCFSIICCFWLGCHLFYFFHMISYTFRWHNGNFRSAKSLIHSKHLSFVPHKKQQFCQVFVDFCLVKLVNCDRWFVFGTI